MIILFLLNDVIIGKRTCFIWPRCFSFGFCWQKDDIPSVTKRSFPINAFIGPPRMSFYFVFWNYVIGSLTPLFLKIRNNYVQLMRRKFDILKSILSWLNCFLSTSYWRGFDGLSGYVIYAFLLINILLSYMKFYLILLKANKECFFIFILQIKMF